MVRDSLGCVTGRQRYEATGLSIKECLVVTLLVGGKPVGVDPVPFQLGLVALVAVDEKSGNPDNQTAYSCHLKKKDDKRRGKENIRPAGDKKGKDYRYPYNNSGSKKERVEVVVPRARVCGVRFAPHDPFPGLGKQAAYVDGL